MMRVWFCYFSVLQCTSYWGKAFDLHHRDTSHLEEKHTCIVIPLRSAAAGVPPNGPSPPSSAFWWHLYEHDAFGYLLCLWCLSSSLSHNELINFSCYFWMISRKTEIDELHSHEAEDQSIFFKDKILSTHVTLMVYDTGQFSYKQNY